MFHFFSFFFYIGAGRKKSAVVQDLRTDVYMAHSSACFLKMQNNKHEISQAKYFLSEFSVQDNFEIYQH